MRLSVQISYGERSSNFFNSACEPLENGFQRVPKMVKCHWYSNFHLQWCILARRNSVLITDHKHLSQKFKLSQVSSLFEKLSCFGSSRGAVDWKAFEERKSLLPDRQLGIACSISRYWRISIGKLNSIQDNLLKKRSLQLRTRRSICRLRKA